MFVQILKQDYYFLSEGNKNQHCEEVFENLIGAASAIFLAYTFGETFHFVRNLFVSK